MARFRQGTRGRALGAAALALGIAAGITLTGTPAAALPGYVVVDLGTDLGTPIQYDADLFSGRFRLSINASGVVAGSIPMPNGSSHAAISDVSGTHDLGTLGDASSVTIATGINAAGQITGLWGDKNGNQSHAFLYSGGAMHELNTAGLSYIAAHAINDAGAVVGLAVGPGLSGAFLYDSTGLHDLGTLDGGSGDTPGVNHSSDAFAINHAGQVVGWSSTANREEHAFLYDGAGMHDLGTLPGSHWSSALAINDAGQIVGQSFVSSWFRAFLYDSTGMHDLGTSGLAYGINNQGQIVGESDDAGQHAFLYSGGVMTDVNSLLPANSGWVLTEAHAINDAGQIVGLGTLNGEKHAFLLTFPTDPRAIPPPAPTGLSVTTASTTELDLSWTDDSKNETGFEIQRQAAGGDWTTAGVTAANAGAFRDTGLTSFTHYTYRVRALSGAGSSAWSGEAGGDTGPPAQVSLSVSGTLDLGSQTTSAAGGVQRLVITNSGGGTLTLGSLTLSGANPGDFAVIPSATTIAPGGQATLTIVFTPTGPGSRSAVLTINSSAPAQGAPGPPTIVLTGTAAAPLPTSGVGGRVPAGLYAATDLGPTEMFPEGMAINDAGQVAWTRGVVGQFDRAFLYDAGGMRPLTTPASLEVVPGLTEGVGGDTVAYGINRTGQVAGFQNISGNSSPHALLWDGAGIHSLNPLLGDSYSVARAINDAGEVAGYGQFAEDWGKQGHHAFLYDGTSMHNLGTLPGDKESFAYGINNAGQVVGRSGSPADWFHNSFGPSGHAFLYDGTGHPQAGTRDLGTLPGDDQSAAYVINDAGQVFGMSWSSATGRRRPFMYDSAGMHGPDVSWAAPGGAAPPPVAMEGTLWVNGAVVDLNSRLAPGSNLHLLLVHGINGRGQIVGEGRSSGMEDGPMHAFLLTPIPAAEGRFSPETVTFGPEPVGTASATGTVTLTNTGELPLTVKQLTLTGSNPGDFAITRDSGETTLAPGAVRTLQITFTPSAVGTRAAALGIAGDDPTAAPLHALSLSGEGTAPAISVSPTSLSFGDQRVGTSSSEQTVTVTNSGTAPLSIRGISIQGPNAADFTATSVTGPQYPPAAGTRPSAAPALTPGESRTLSVRFTPLAGGSRSAVLVIASDAAAQGAPGPARLGLTGAGVAPVVSISPGGLEFGPQPVGMVNDAQAITLQNTGNAPLDLQKVTLDGADPGDFIISADGWTGAHLLPGQIATLNLRFTPTAAGSRTASLTVTDNAPAQGAPGPQRVPLSGTGTAAAVSLSATTLSFGDQPVGTASAEQTVTLTNNGTAPLTVGGVSFAGANAGDFTAALDPGSATLAPGESRAIHVRFRPTGPGSRTATLVISDDSPAQGSPHTVPLSGAGTAPGITFGISRLSSPGSLSFGSVPLGASSAPQTLTLTNSGNAPLTIGSITLAGGSPGDYQITGDSGGSTLAPGATRTLTLRFTPRDQGGRGAALVLTDNAAGGQQTVSLSGAGVLPSRGSRGPGLIPTSVELVVVSIDGTDSHTAFVNAGQATVVTAGQHVTLKLLLKFANGASADVTGDANSHLGAGMPAGKFTGKAVWSAGPNDAGRTVVIYGSYRSPLVRKLLQGTVTLTVRGARRGRR